MLERHVVLGFAGCLGVAACAGSTGPTGPAGQQGTAGTNGAGGTASISGVEPSTVYAARTTHVTVSGYGTSWTDKTSVSFGPGITVANVHAASPTALVADLTIDKTAALGARDVVVNDSTPETYSQAFTVSLPATLELDGTLAQGGIAIVNVQLQDLSTPFDTTGSTDPLSGETTYTNLALSTPSGVTANIQSATTTSLQIVLTLDVDAAVTTADFDLLSGPADGTDVEFPVPGWLAVTAQKATPLGTSPVTGSVKSPYASTLYSYTTAGALSIVDITATSNAANANAGFILLPGSGHFADAIGQFQASDGATTSATTTLLPTSATAYYVIYWDDSGTTGAYTLGAASTPPASTLPTTLTDDTQAGAIVATALPFVLTGGNLTSDTSIDWVQVTTGPGDGGKLLHVQTEGDPYTDVTVNILTSDGTTSIGGEETGGTVDTLSTVAVTASTTYYVTFAAGVEFDPSDGTYDAIIRLE